jgi:hypothetical protein
MRTVSEVLRAELERCRLPVHVIAQECDVPLFSLQRFVANPDAGISTKSLDRVARYLGLTLQPTGTRERPNSIYIRRLSGERGLETKRERDARRSGAE